MFVLCFQDIISPFLIVSLRNIYQLCKNETREWAVHPVVPFPGVLPAHRLNSPLKT